MAVTGLQTLTSVVVLVVVETITTTATLMVTKGSCGIENGPCMRMDASAVTVTLDWTSLKDRICKVVSLVGVAAYNVNARFEAVPQLS